MSLKKKNLGGKARHIEASTSDTYSLSHLDFEHDLNFKPNFEHNQPIKPDQQSINCDQKHLPPTYSQVMADNIMTYTPERPNNQDARDVENCCEFAPGCECNPHCECNPRCGRVSWSCKLPRPFWALLFLVVLAVVVMATFKYLLRKSERK
jgi:hypothetical protein